MEFRFLLTTIFLALFGQGYACSCNDLPTREAALKSSDLVIYGKVISTQIISFAKTIDKNKVSAFKKGLNGDKSKLDMLESNYKLLTPIAELTIDGHTFFSSKFLMTRGDREYKQVCYATQVDKYFVGIIATDDIKQPEPEIEKIIESIKFR